MWIVQVYDTVKGTFKYEEFRNRKAAEAYAEDFETIASLYGQAGRYTKISVQYMS
jgi:5'-3' exonuclease